jgi:hypothetical protein
MKYGILWQPTNDNFRPAWVLDDTYSVALYADERSAKRDRKQFVHPEQYEVHAYNARARRTWT